MLLDWAMAISLACLGIALIRLNRDSRKESEARFIKIEEAAQERFAQITEAFRAEFKDMSKDSEDRFKSIWKRFDEQKDVTQRAISVLEEKVSREFVRKETHDGQITNLKEAMEREIRSLKEMTEQQFKELIRLIKGVRNE